MKSTLKILAAHQKQSGQFPTVMLNETEGVTREVHTIAPTYLICLILSEVRDHQQSHYLLDKIIERGTSFLSRMCYVDPVVGLRAWHFNAFYPPDWEETAWNSYLLYKSGILTKSELEPLRRLALANETSDKGVGVWLKDDYTLDNGRNNVFDPVVSLSVNQFLQRVFGEISAPTEDFINDAVESNQKSVYYVDNFKNFLLCLFGARKEKVALDPGDNYSLFHHGNRTDVQYTSRDVWEAAKLFAA